MESGFPLSRGMTQNGEKLDFLPEAVDYLADG